MNLLPIVELELRSAARRSGTYWSRFWIGSVGVILLAALIFIAQSPLLGAVRMSSVFAVVRFAGLIYCLVAGVRLTFDCVSQEKRDGTLGFLFLTPLRGHDVILGKLFAKGVIPAHTMMVLVPLVWLVSLVGGIGAAELFYTVVAFGNTLFFSLAVGITASTFLRDRRRCEVIASMSAFVLFFGILPLIDAGIISLFTGTSGFWWLGSAPAGVFANRVDMLANPAFSIGTGVQTALIANAVMHLVSWGLIAISSWWVPRSWQERPPSGTRLSLREWWRQWTYGAGPRRQLRRRTALEINPFLWRATRNRLRPLMPWCWVLITVAIPICLAAAAGFTPTPALISLTQVLLIVALVFWFLAPKIWIAREASRTLAEERHDGTLEMVLSTRISVPEIIHGQWLGLRRNLLVALLFPILFVAGLLLLFHFAPELDWLKFARDWTGWLVAGTLLFVADCFAMGWVGMWCGLKLGDPKAAARDAWSKVVIQPALLSAVCFLALALLTVSPGFRVQLPHLLLGLWLVIGLTFDLISIFACRALLVREFRTIVQEPASGRDAWARSLARWLARNVRPGNTRRRTQSAPD